METLFTNGEESSRSKLVSAFEALLSTGQSVLDDVEEARADTLFRFQLGLSALNSRRQRAARVLSPDIACRFIMSDLIDIDQARSSATLRSDSQAATLRERSQATDAAIRTMSFTANIGIIEEFSGMYRVYSEDGQKPVGVFEIELATPLTISFLTFDIVTTPSEPSIRVLASENDVSYTEATSVSRNGYRVNAWLPLQAVRFLRIEISPSHADQIGGSTFTFGLTSFNASAIDFHLYSELAFRPLRFEPLTSQVRFRAEGEGLVYFLAFGNGRTMKVDPDQLISLPGVEKVSVDTHINTDWKLCALNSETPYQLPVGIYPSTLAILDVDDTKAVRVVYNMDPGTVSEAVVNTYAFVWDRLIQRYPKSDALYIAESGRTWRLNFTRGPATLDAHLTVQIESRTRAKTPVFRGAYLEHVY